MGAVDSSAADGRDVIGAVEELAASSTVRIDRPRGSVHPRYPHARYPLDYGYLEETTSSDGEGLDVFVGTARRAGVAGVVLTVDTVKRDIEAKVLLDCTGDEVALVLRFLTGELGLPCHVLRRGDGDAPA